MSQRADKGCSTHQGSTKNTYQTLKRVRKCQQNVTTLASSLLYCPLYFKFFTTFNTFFFRPQSVPHRKHSLNQEHPSRRRIFTYTEVFKAKYLLLSCDFNRNQNVSSNFSKKKSHHRKFHETSSDAIPAVHVDKRKNKHDDPKF